MPIVTALYAGLLGLISIGVAFPAGSLRGRLNVSVGDGGNRDLLLGFTLWVPPWSWGAWHTLSAFERTR